jgi:hypothetical protein
MHFDFQSATAPGSRTSLPAISRPVLQRKCACGGNIGSTGECHACRATHSGPEASHNHDDGVSAPSIVNDVLRSPGQPLDPEVRATMEPYFGHDFSQVRVHADAKAAKSAESVDGLAYTVGQQVVFGAGRYAPRTRQGLQLLAHELTHTIQQSGVGAASLAARQPIAIEPPGTRFEHAAEERSTSLAPNAAPLAPLPQLALQRQPADQPVVETTAESSSESDFTIFVGDEKNRTNRRFARQEAQADAARIRKSGTLSTADRQLVKAKLRFFEGRARETYSQLIRPALIAVTQEEIQMPGDGSDVAGPSLTAAKLKPYDLSDRFKQLRQSPEYIDNNIKEVNYNTAETAVVHYRDGSKFELGLVPRFMKPPVVEVDYHTSLADFRIYEDADTKRIGFVVESEMANSPRGMMYPDLLKSYARYIDFYVEPGTGRIVPSRINMLTAPTLCGVLVDSERRYREQIGMAAQIGLGGTAAIGGYAGAGGFSKAPSVATNIGRRVALSGTARTLAREMDNLLATGGTKSITVEGVALSSVQVSMRGSVLAVRRFMSKLPEVLRGKGTGMRVTAEFEKAAVEVARLNGAKTVTIDVGIIVNEGWRKLLEARGYVHVLEEGAWIKTIIL